MNTFAFFLKSFLIKAAFATSWIFVGGASNTLNDGIISYWKMDEDATTRVDSLGLNSLDDASSVGKATGKVNDAGNFVAASSDYIQHADNGHQIPAGAHSWAYWFKPASFPAFGAAISKWAALNSGATYLFIWVNDSSKRAQYALSDGTLLGTVDSSVSMSAGTFYCVFGWWDGANEIGVQVGTQGSPGSAETAAWAGPLNQAGTGVPLRFGQAQSPSNLYVDALIDGVGFWNRKLTDAERTDFCNNPRDYPF